MKKQGFTLIELLAVIVLIAVIAMIALPSITSQLSKSKGEVNSTASDAMITAAELYLDNNVNLKPFKVDTNFCITLQVLVDNGNLKAPIKNLETGKNMDLKANAIQVTYHADKRLIKEGKLGLLTDLTCNETIK